MKHLLMDPHFPDMVGEWAESQAQTDAATCANDNCEECMEEINDPLIRVFARLDVSASRLW